MAHRVGRSDVARLNGSRPPCDRCLRRLPRPPVAAPCHAQAIVHGLPTVRSSGSLSVPARSPLLHRRTSGPASRPPHVLPGSHGAVLIGPRRWCPAPPAHHPGECARGRDQKRCRCDRDAQEQGNTRQGHQRACHRLPPAASRLTPKTRLRATTSPACGSRASARTESVHCLSLSKGGARSAGRCAHSRPGSRPPRAWHPASDR